MSAVEKLVLRLQAVSGVDWSASGRGRLYEEQKGNFTAILSDPAVVAELFAETLTRKAIIALNAGIDVVLAEYESDGLLPPDMSQFRRLLTQEGGERNPCPVPCEAEVATREDASLATPDLPNGKCRHLTRKVMPNHSVVYDACSLPAVTEGYCGKHASDLLPKEESNG